MKRLLISAFAICFAMAIPTALMADEPKHDQDKSHGSTGGTPPKGNKGTSGGGSMGGSMKMMGTHKTDHHTAHTGGGMGGMGGGMGQKNKSHVTVDFTKYHKAVTATRQFHWGDYHAPEGYSYRRWNYGDRLPSIYFAQDFWINSYLNFGLETPPDDCVWVRYGPDALLIDEDTGEIVEVEYGLFY